MRVRSLTPATPRASQDTAAQKAKLKADKDAVKAMQDKIKGKK